MAILTMQNAIDKLSSPDPNIRIEGVNALGRSADAEAMPYLQAIVETDPDERVKRYARSALENLRRVLKTEARTADQPNRPVTPRRTTATYVNGHGRERPAVEMVEASSWADAWRVLLIYAAVSAIGPVLLGVLGMGGLRFFIRATLPLPDAISHEILRLLALDPQLVVLVLLGLGVFITVVGFFHMVLTHLIARQLGGENALPVLIYNVLPALTWVQVANFVISGVAFVLLGIGILPLLSTVHLIALLVVNFSGMWIASYLVGQVYGFGAGKGLLTYLGGLISASVLTTAAVAVLVMVI
jgi:hypothetical protein